MRKVLKANAVNEETPIATAPPRSDIRLKIIIRRYSICTQASCDTSAVTM